MPRLNRKDATPVAPLLLKVPEAAHRLNVCERHIYNLADQNVLEKVKLGAAVRITLASVLALAGQRATDPE